MKDEKLIDKNWVDIVPIQIVDEPDYMLLVMIVSGLLLTLSTFIYFYARRPGNIIRRQLNSLASQVKDHDNKLILFNMEKILLDYFQVSQLSQITFNGTSFTGISFKEVSPAGSTTEQVWSEFKIQLQESCYSSSCPDDETTHNLIQQARLVCGKNIS